MRYYLQRDRDEATRPPAAERTRLLEQLKVERQDRRDGRQPSNPLTPEERETICGYEYALGPAAIADDDVTVPAGWGMRAQAEARGAGYASNDVAAQWATLLGCMVTAFEAPPPEAPPPAVDPDVARRARVAAHLAAERERAAELAAEKVQSLRTRLE